MKTYFMWKEMVEDIDGDGAWHALTPWDDPMVYEYPINFVFDTVEEAQKWLVEESEESWNVERSESDDWVLVKFTETIMPQGIPENGYPWEQ